MVTDRAPPFPPAVARDSRVTQLAWLAAALCLGYALQLSWGMYHPRALLLLTAALVLALLAALLRAARFRIAVPGRLVEILLAAAVLFELILLAVAPAGMYLGRASPAVLYGGLLVAAGLLGLCLAGGSRMRQVCVPALLLTYLVIGAWLVRASPNPAIDVYLFQRDAVNRLLAGGNPYAMTFPDIYGNAQFYAPGLTAGGRVLFGFPYPPLSLLFAIPGQVLAADCRYGQLVAMTAAGALIAYSGRGRTPTLAAALLLFAPKSLFVLEQGWTEPYVVLLLAAVLFAARRRPGVVPWLVGLLLSSKQYLVLLAPSAALLMAGLRPRRSDLLRDYGKALGTAAVVTLPPALWDLPAFWHSTVWVHVRQPFRPDSLAFPGWLYARTGVWLDVWAAFAVALVAVAVVVWRGRGTPAEFAAASALTLGLFFAFSKQAFCNYYYLVVAAWCCAIAVSQTDTASRGSPDPR